MERPECKCKGSIYPGAMCGYVIISTKECGAPGDKECEHKGGFDRGGNREAVMGCKKVEEGESCSPGCLHHVTHPCEKCGRVAGKGVAYLQTPLTISDQRRRSRAISGAG